MKTRKPPRWYEEYDKETRCYHVVKEGFHDSIHRSKHDALLRIIELEELDKNAE